jgi:hypothetical protein
MASQENVCKKGSNRDKVAPRRQPAKPAPLESASLEGGPFSEQVAIRKARTAPHLLSTRDVMQLQRVVGNRVTGRVLARVQRRQPPTAQGDPMQQGELENDTGLPDELKVGVENLSGMSIDDVRVHYNSSKPATLQALAYTQGTDIHVAPGQEGSLAHEAWHVVQQKQNRVRPTMQIDSTAVNADPLLEREADMMGMRALQETGNDNTGMQERGKSTPTSGVPQSSVIQSVFKWGKHSLKDYQDDIKKHLKKKYEKLVVRSFGRRARKGKSYDFPKWARRKKVNAMDVLKILAGKAPDTFEPLLLQYELFGQGIEKEPLLTGAYQKGFVPTTWEGKTSEKKKKKRKKKRKKRSKKKRRRIKRVGRGSHDYSENENQRILQLLRQISTQLYLYLQVNKKLAKREQEIQTMWAYGNLIVGSNQPDTLKNLYEQVTTLVSTQTIHKLYEILKGEYSVTKKKFIRTLSKRIANKLNNLYKGQRQVKLGSPEIDKIMKVLLTGSVEKITDVTDKDQVKKVANTTGNIYFLVAESLNKYNHAEQRLIEFLDIVQNYKETPIAWVAGKKRPCFGCWIRERHTNEKKKYTLVHQNRPGKAFFGTYKVAPRDEQEKWKDLLKDSTTCVYENDQGSGEIGDESESEPESDEELVIPKYTDKDKFLDDYNCDVLSEKQKKVINRHIEMIGQDPVKFKEDLGKFKEDQKKVTGKRKRPGEERLEKVIRELVKFGKENPAIGIYDFSEHPNKKQKISPSS